MHFTVSNNFLIRFATSIILGLLFWAIYFYLPPIFFSIVLLSILLLIIVYEWTRFFPINTPLFWLLMPPYLILPFGLLIVLNHNPHYHILLAILFILVFSFDTGSYITGNIIGKHPICQSISPKKTWEGVVGGYIFALLGFAFIIWEQGYNTPCWLVAPFTLMVCLLSLAGDLFESWLKRLARLKDSGTMLPGHGGFLDRFDGILFASFFFYLCKDYLLRLLIK